MYRRSITVSLLVIVGLSAGWCEDSSDSDPSEALELEKTMSRAQDLAGQYAQLDPNDEQQASTLRNRLKSTLDRAFDLRQQLQRLQIKAARSDLDRIERQLEERDQYRDQIVRRKLEEMVTGANLSWADDSVAEDRSLKSRDTIRSGDVLAIYLEGVLPFSTPNTPPTPPPVTKLNSGQVVTGFPIVVTSDGTIQLPLIDRIKVDGLTIRQAEAKVAETYVRQDILLPKKARPMMMLIRPDDWPRRGTRQEFAIPARSGSE